MVRRVLRRVLMRAIRELDRRSARRPDEEVVPAAKAPPVASAPAPVHPPRPPPRPPSPRLPQDEEQRIRDLLATRRWFHAFEVAPGIHTPGHIHVDGCDYLDSLHVPRDLRGKSAIDIGTWDGYLAFELARRGAKTVGFDIQDPERTGFNVARQVTGLDVEYVHAPNGAYALPDAVQGRTFDLVFFMAIWAAVKSPLVAFERAASLMHEGSVLYFEGEAMQVYAEDSSGKPVRGPELERLAQSDVPLALCCSGSYRGGGNWFIPNVAAIRSWLKAAGLEVIELHPILNTTSDPPNQRAVGWARKVRQGELPEHELM